LTKICELEIAGRTPLALPKLLLFMLPFVFMLHSLALFLLK